MSYQNPTAETREFMDGVGFHPADTPRKQQAHEAARLLVGLLATHLIRLLPPGRDKSLTKTHLEDVLMRANRALAIGGGPAPTVPDDDLDSLIRDCKRVMAELGAQMPEDARIGVYKAEQLIGRAEKADAATHDALAAMDPFEYVRESDGLVERLGMAITAVGGPAPEAKITASNDDEGENVHHEAEVWIDDPDELERAGNYFLAMAAQLRALQGR